MRSSQQSEDFLLFIAFPQTRIIPAENIIIISHPLAENVEVTHLPSRLRCHCGRDAMFSYGVELPEVTGLIEFVPAEVVRIHYKSHRLK